MRETTFARLYLPVIFTIVPIILGKKLWKKGCKVGNQGAVSERAGVAHLLNSLLRLHSLHTLHKITCTDSAPFSNISYF